MIKKPILILIERPNNFEGMLMGALLEILPLLARCSIPFEIKPSTAGFTGDVYRNNYSAVIVPLLGNTAAKNVIKTWLDGSIPAFVAQAYNTGDTSGFTAGVASEGNVCTSSTYYMVTPRTFDGRVIGTALDAPMAVYCASYCSKDYAITDAAHVVPLVYSATKPADVWVWAWTGGLYPVFYSTVTYGGVWYLLHWLGTQFGVKDKILLHVDIDDADARSTGVGYLANASYIDSFLSRISSLGGYALCGFKPDAIDEMPDELKQVFIKHKDNVISIVHHHLGTAGADEYWWHEKEITLTGSAWGNVTYDTSIIGQMGTSKASPGTGKLGAFSYSLNWLKQFDWVPNIQDNQHYMGYAYLPNNGYSWLGINALASIGTKFVRLYNIAAMIPTKKGSAPIATNYGGVVATSEFFGTIGTSDSAKKLYFNQADGLFRSSIPLKSLFSIYAHANELSNDTSGQNRYKSLMSILDLIDLAQPFMRLQRVGEKFVEK